MPVRKNITLLSPNYVSVPIYDNKYNMTIPAPFNAMIFLQVHLTWQIPHIHSVKQPDALEIKTF